MSRARRAPVKVAQLQPNVGSEEAGEMLRRYGHGLLRAPLRAIAQTWVPYHLFEISVDDRGRQSTRILALDALEGSLDLLSVDTPEPIPTSDRPGPNHLVPLLTAKQAAELMHGRLLRMTFLRGFFRVRGALPRPKSLEQLLYVPYWVGFYGYDEVSRVRVVDAVRRTVEGGKAVDLISRSLGIV